MALIYIIEDDESIREIEEFALRNAGHNVVGFGDATSFYRQMESILPNLILLDVMLPDVNGNDIVRRLRKNADTRRIPVIMVTAKTSELDLLKGLDDGADDYIRKPFSVMELIARVKVQLRRADTEEMKQMAVGEIELNDEKREVTVQGQLVELTYKEYELLRYLMLNQGIVLSRDKLMEHVWDTDFQGESRTLDMHIKTLRQKLGDSGTRIRTVRNVGYTMD